MKLCFISDTHNQHNGIKIPKCDVLIHCGDLTSMGSLVEVSKAVKWLGDLRIMDQCANVILVPGNHDWLAEKDEPLFKQICSDNGIIYLNDSGIKLDGINYWGSGITPEFCGWALNRARTVEDSIKMGIGYIGNHWDLIPNETNVLITHGPPAGIRDTIYRSDGVTPKERVGDTALFNKILTLPQLKVHAFGHIHSSYGIQHFRDVTYINAAILDDRYFIKNDPIIIELEGDKDEN